VWRTVAGVGFLAFFVVSWIAFLSTPDFLLIWLILTVPVAASAAWFGLGGLYLYWLGWRADSHRRRTEEDSRQGRDAR
jgi:threonine/homoserine/homoserine lactone efflux protein